MGGIVNPAGLAAETDPLAVLKALIDAKGDLIVGSAADAVTRLAVDTNGKHLTADSAQASGVKWATIPFLQTVNFLPGGSVDAATVVPDALFCMTTGQTARLVRVLANIETGGITVQPRRNGSSAGLSSFAVDTDSTWEGLTGLNIALADLDVFDFTLSSPTGSPANLSVAFVIEHTV